MKKLIVITGADGAGKSSLIKSLTETQKGLREIAIWDAMDSNLFQSKQDIDDYLCTLTANARLLFLAHALTQSIEKAQHSAATVIIANGYFYKYFASELALGADRNLVNQLVHFFPKPDLVIRLVADEVLTANRKERFTQYECGLQKPTLDAFLTFQKKVTAQWSAFNQSHWKKIAASQNQKAVLDEVLAVLNSTRI